MASGPRPVQKTLAEMAVSARIFCSLQQPQIIASIKSKDRIFALEAAKVAAQKWYLAASYFSTMSSSGLIRTR
jgi:hypothetical protein